MSEDERLIQSAAEHGYEYPSVRCSECGGPTYFLPDEDPQGSGHYLYHDHGGELIS